MPTTSQSVSISGTTQTGEGVVYVTYQDNILGNLVGPSVDVVPGFFYYMGNVEYRQDDKGNVLAVTRNADGSLP